MLFSNDEASELSDDFTAYLARRLELVHADAASVLGKLLLAYEPAERRPIEILSAANFPR